MSTSKRLLFLLAGLVLLLPGACSAYFTPVLLGIGGSLLNAGPHLMHPGDLGTVRFFAWIGLAVCVGFAIAIAGSRLIVCAMRGQTDYAAPQWVLVLTGLLLLCPGLTALLLLGWDPVRLFGSGTFLANLLGLTLLLAPAFVALGAYLLWQARRARIRGGS